MPISTQLLATITSRLNSAEGHVTPASVLQVWQTMFGKFNPLLGPLGVQLVFARSLVQASERFPWLPGTTPTTQRDAFAAFACRLDSLEQDELLAVNHDLLAVFTAILDGLIGERLATRLLRSAFPEDDPDKNTLENTA